MKSIVDELLDKIREDPSLIRRSGPRQDLGLLLFNEREALNALWKAAAALPRPEGSVDAAAELGAAVERLRPIFGER